MYVSRDMTVSTRDSGSETERIFSYRKLLGKND